jgi:hypothetical protein
VVITHNVSESDDPDSDEHRLRRYTRPGCLPVLVCYETVVDGNDGGIVQEFKFKTIFDYVLECGLPSRTILGRINKNWRKTREDNAALSQFVSLQKDCIKTYLFSHTWKAALELWQRRKP